ncbi:alpha/beta hydrolase [Methanobrevibacter sp.]|uniref:alpha/beta hydrolase n=1 Tax=Methanobrevibacter sp. TaxID=66852 RepID=UPI0025ED242B|nr:alpha/beta hydrolase [Methanobrevibacter sp.]MBQ2961576.1 alpha/beta hydrolase [Methanobrevibacter sp.]
MNKKLKIALGIILALVIVIAGSALWYVNDYYHAEPSATALLEGDENVTVTQIDNGLLLDGPGNDSALIFYPGAKIEYTSYLPLFMDLADDGVDCFIVEMPYNLAIFGMDSADEIVNDNAYDYQKWYICGHSLGGVMASYYSLNHTDDLDGLILLAAYPADDLGNMSVLSIYGSNDKTLNKETYDESKSLMDYNLTEYVIEGGNHAQFGSYGNQSGDGAASISAENQRKQTKNEILEFIN